MSAKNRTDLKTEVAAWSAMLDLETDHKPTEQNILDSVLLNRDVVNSTQHFAAGDVTLNFTGYDVFDFTTTNNNAISFSGINDGEVKYLIIRKSAGNVITFPGSISGVLNNTYVSELTYLAFKIIKKGVSTPVQTIITPLFASLDYSDIPTPETPTAWQQLSLLSPWAASDSSGIRSGVWYRTNRDYIDISISISRTLAYNGNIGVLPSGTRPAFNYKTAIYAADAMVGAAGHITIRTDGSVFVGGFQDGYDPMSINAFISIPLT